MEMIHVPCFDYCHWIYDVIYSLLLAGSMMMTDDFSHLLCCYVFYMIADI